MSENNNFLNQVNNSCDSIRFNNKTVASRTLARDQLSRLQAKAKHGLVWLRVSKVDRSDIGPDAFALECSQCGKSCQLGNPAKWHNDHTEETCRLAVASTLCHGKHFLLLNTLEEEST